jgi:hypothetical protein
MDFSSRSAQELHNQVRLGRRGMWAPRGALHGGGSRPAGTHIGREVHLRAALGATRLRPP